MNPDLFFSTDEMLPANQNPGMPSRQKRLPGFRHVYPEKQFLNLLVTAVQLAKQPGAPDVKSALETLEAPADGRSLADSDAPADQTLPIPVDLTGDRSTQGDPAFIPLENEHIHPGLQEEAVTLDGTPLAGPPVEGWFTGSPGYTDLPEETHSGSEENRFLKGYGPSSDPTGPGSFQLIDSGPSGPIKGQSLVGKSGLPQTEAGYPGGHLAPEQKSDPAGLGGRITNESGSADMQTGGHAADSQTSAHATEHHPSGMSTDSGSVEMIDAEKSNHPAPDQYADSRQPMFAGADRSRLNTVDVPVTNGQDHPGAPRTPAQQAPVSQIDTPEQPGIGAGAGGQSDRQFLPGTSGLPVDAQKSAAPESLGGRKGSLPQGTQEIFQPEIKAPLNQNSSGKHQSHAGDDNGSQPNLSYGKPNGQPDKAGIAFSGLDEAPHNPNNSSGNESVRIQDERLLFTSASKDTTADSLSRQGESAEAKSETQQLSAEAERFSRVMRFNQIVDKAALHFKQGASEVQIELKPEFLGRVRMQIAAENNQVTVKIMAELPAVREIIEGNLSQLKSELNNQGVDVDRLDVSVFSDADRNGRRRHQARHAKADPQNRIRKADTNSMDDQRDKRDRLQPGQNRSESGISFFA